MSDSVVKISLTTQREKDMACKHLTPDGRCDITRDYLGDSKMCDYIEFDKDETHFCYYYEASLDEVMRLPIYDIKTKEL